MRDPVRWHVVPLRVVLTAGLLGGATMVGDRGAPAGSAGAGPGIGSAASRAPTQRLRARFATLPVSFEPNVGQAALPVRFLARGRGYMLYLTGRGATLTLTSSQARSSVAPGRQAPLPTPRTTVVRMAFLGANPAAAMQAEGRQPGVSNYLRGADPRAWRAGVPHYSRVRYRGIYPGVDLVYYGAGPRLEYDAVLAPGAHPRAIRLAFAGVHGLRVDGAGNLALRTAAGTLVERAPLAYQRGPHGRIPVAARLVVRGRDEVGFALAEYDRHRALVIDPVLRYSTYLGGSDGGYTVGAGIAVDRTGAAYVTGATVSNAFPTTPQRPVRTAPRSGDADAFVTKLSPDGRRLLYSTYLGGRGNDAGAGIAVDRAGAAYLTGATGSRNFPTTRGAFQTTLTGVGGNAFVAKLSPDGRRLLYATLLGGKGIERGRGVAVDRVGAAYVIGETNSRDFPTTRGAFQAANKGGGYAPFVTKLAPNGRRLLYATFLSGSYRDGDTGAGIAVDGTGAAYVTGLAGSPDFPTTRGAFRRSIKSRTGSAYVAKLAANGRRLIYATLLGGRGNTLGSGLAVDKAGAAYVTGATSALDFPTTRGAYQTILKPGDTDAYVTKLSPDGRRLLYATLLGGKGTTLGNGLALDRAGAAYVTGTTNTTSFPITRDALPTAHLRAEGHAFVAELAPLGQRLLYATYVGGRGAEKGRSVAVDDRGAAYITGETASHDFPTTRGAVQTVPRAGATAAFVLTLAPNRGR